MSTCFGMVNQNSCASLTFGVRKMVLHYGMWDQIRTDQGKEWNLMLFVNDSLSHLRNDCSRPPTCNPRLNRCYTPNGIFSIQLHCHLISRITWWSACGLK